MRHDQATLDAFVARHGLPAYHPAVAAVPPGMMQAANDAPTDRDTLTVHMTQGGLPLSVLSEPKQLRSAFLEVRRHTRVPPCLADRRYGTLPGAAPPTV